MVSRALIGSTAGVTVAVAGAFAATGAARAGFTPPPFLMTWDADGDAVGPNMYNWDPKYGGFGTMHGWGDWMVDKSDDIWTGWRYSGDLVGPSDLWDLSWNCVFYDGSGTAASGTSAFVTANIVVTNNSNSTQGFSLLMSLPVARAILSPLERGSIVGTVTDLSFDDALVSAPPGGSIYTSRIDTVDEVSLLSDPFSQAAGGPLQSHVVGPADFGLPNVIPASQDVDSSIAILLSFRLSAHDSASFTAIFEVIPGPGALPVLAAFGLLGGRRRRRA